MLNLTASQDRLRKLRDTLSYTKETVTKRGGDLSIALNRSHQYKEMIRLLELMYPLLPIALTKGISCKQFPIE